MVFFFFFFLTGAFCRELHANAMAFSCRLLLTYCGGWLVGWLVGRERERESLPVVEPNALSARLINCFRSRKRSNLCIMHAQIRTTKNRNSGFVGVSTNLQTPK